MFNLASRWKELTLGASKTTFEVDGNGIGRPTTIVGMIFTSDTAQKLIINNAADTTPVMTVRLEANKTLIMNISFVADQGLKFGTVSGDVTVDVYYKNVGS